MALTLGFHGGAGTVTGSRHLLDADGKRLLIDCGLFQGLKELRLRNWRPTPFRAASVDAVILTHAHIDHSGYLPRLVREGFRGRIYCTRATHELAGILLRDAAKLQEEGFSKHHPALPLFTERDARAALKQFRAVDHDRWFDVAGYSVCLRNAGHILGSAFAEVVAPVSEEASTTIIFSGDVGRYDAPLHANPEVLPACDTLVLESTYGNRIHDTTPLIEEIGTPFLETIARGGTILIPAFAVARAQLVTLLLGQLMDAGALPRIPIEMDSPMAVDVTEVYARYLGSDELDPAGKSFRGRLFSDNVSFYRSVGESKALNNQPGPRIIISSSGMLSGGRVLHHLRRLLPDPNNLIVLAGYQAAGTRGRALLEGAPTLRMHGMDVPVRARFISVEGLSAHADANELLQWVQSGPTRPRNIFLTHGEPEAASALSQKIAQLGLPVTIPQLSDVFGFDAAKGAWHLLSPA
jgi:metallo-beta-lactamase family protein